MTLDLPTRLLGKLPAQPPHAMLSEFLDFERAAATLEIPANIVNSNGQRTPLAMYLNDREADCTCAGVGNSLRVDSNGTHEIPDTAVQNGYIAVTGQEGAAYDPATGDNDNGAAEIDVLDLWSQPGNPFGDVLAGHAAVDIANQTHLRTALYMTGALYGGWQLSIAQQTQKVWQRATHQAGGQPGSWGGHCALIVDWYQTFTGHLNGVAVTGPVLTIGTWGLYQPALPNFVPAYADEMHATLTDAWLARWKPSGLLDVPKIEAYFATLRRES